MSVSLKNLSSTVDSISTTLTTFMTVNSTLNIVLNEINHMVASGAFHSVFIKSNNPMVATGAFKYGFFPNNNTAMTCGDNTYGQLGIGSYNHINKPSYVKKNINTNLTNVKSVHAGTYHTIFLLNDGTVYACGDNTYGQLGLGNNTRQNYATLITGLTNVKSISCGAYHTIFILNDGNDTVKACGKNTNGQLGDGTTSDKNAPVNVIKSGGGNLTNVKQISSNQFHTMFLLNDGKVMGCGINDKGQIGDGTILERLNPVDVKDSTGNIFTDVVKIASGTYHTIFLKNNGIAYGCGIYFIEFIANSTTPVSFAENVTNIYSGDLSIIYLVNNETYYTNGYNLFGLLGSSVNINLLIDSPQEVVLPTKTIYISIGKMHSLFYSNDTAIIASGYNINGQLGIGKNSDYEILQNVILLNGFKVYSCGFNGNGQLGQGKNYGATYQTVLVGTPDVPTQITANISDINITQISAGGFNNSLFLDSNGRVYGCGGYPATGNTGQNNIVTEIYLPTLIASANIFTKFITQISTGYFHSLFLDSNGKVYGCGSSTVGQLGGIFDKYIEPTQITATISDKFITQISAGANQSLFLDKDGRVYSCGANTYGETGQNTTTGNTPEPTLINSVNISDKIITQVYASRFFSMFLDKDGKVYSCGENANGKTGQNTTVGNISVPTQITINISGKFIVQVSIGWRHSLFLDKDGKVYSCGENLYGQLGHNDTTQRTVPTLIEFTNISTKIIKQISAGEGYSLFLDSIGRVYSCGRNANGRTGQNTIDGNILVPTQIASTNISDKFITQISAGLNHSLFLQTN